MPALAWTGVPNIVDRNDAANFTPSALPANGSSNALQVVCAWPVSGQYGAGSRVLYYVLVATCVFARKTEWLRNACLAAALLFPAVAAIHGIVLAAMHVNGAVDMDVYGAFQLCAIGILAAPVTVRLSTTYFYDPGRNTIFLWTGLLLAGLLSLTVEFYRVETADCTHDTAGNPISVHPAKFPYGDNITCGLTCSVEHGPYSPMRSGSANNIYVVPAPDKFTFGAATLLAAACCIPAILSLISMWNKILEINWTTRFGPGDEDERIDEPIEGTNGATIRKMRVVNTMIRSLMSRVEVPLFGGVVLAILVIGERNLFSSQVNYMTEPIASIGQWGPIAGAALAALGSLYLLFAVNAEAGRRQSSSSVSMHHCSCSHHDHDEGIPAMRPHPGVDHLPSTRDTGIGEDGGAGDAPQDSIDLPAMQEIGGTQIIGYSRSDTALGTPEVHPRSSNELMPTTSPTPSGQDRHAKQPRTSDTSNRRLTGILTGIGNYFGTPAPDWSNDSEFKHGKALDFPEIPGEEHRNYALLRIREQYNQHREADGSSTPALRHQRSRAGSFCGSVASGVLVESGSTPLRGASLELAHITNCPSSSSSPIQPAESNDSNSPAGRKSFDAPNPASVPSVGSTGDRVSARRNTLEVPPQAHHPPMRGDQSPFPATPIITIPGDQRSPTIVISSNPETYFSARPPVSIATSQHSGPQSSPSAPVSPPSS